ncbi:MAG: AAA family ATPase [Fibromonadaceae bacterium]|jgi:predicted ABC-type ATPase|nr:AAA family ATPase [Fibromonadaceae bacterium]
MLTLYIIAGPNGSGKTTLARELAETENLDFLNADDIARSINPQDVSKAYMQAGREFFKKMNELLAARKSIVMETILSENLLEKKMDSSYYEFAAKIICLANRGAKKAQEENRRLGLPNVYAVEGKPIFVMPDGKIETEWL